MSKNRIEAIEYIRGIAMLGVIGIHTGSYSLANPEVNVHLFALLEIFTRFSVPIFFFLSAFGLFINSNLAEDKFNYVNFLRRRARSILIPYLIWSVLYMTHQSWLSGDTSMWMPPKVFENFFLGLTQYHLYWLVILMWFYALMPLWRWIICRIQTNPLPYLSLLFVFQIIFNYYSSYIWKADFSNYYLNLLIQYRLNFLVLHYVFIFLLGAICAIRFQDFSSILRKYSRFITVFFIASLAGILLSYYRLLYICNYGPEAAVNTVHQLSPVGVIYTLASALFWFMLFSLSSPAKWVKTSLHTLGKYSYSVYLAHPFVMYYMVVYTLEHGIVMTAPVTVAFMVIATIVSLLLAKLMEIVGKNAPVIGLGLTGNDYSKIKTRV